MMYLGVMECSGVLGVHSKLYLDRSWTLCSSELGPASEHLPMSPDFPSILGMPFALYGSLGRGWFKCPMNVEQSSILILI